MSPQLTKFARPWRGEEEGSCQGFDGFFRNSLGLRDDLPDVGIADVLPVLGWSLLVVVLLPLLFGWPILVSSAGRFRLSRR